jgi:hypothetical protein
MEKNGMSLEHFCAMFPRAWDDGYWWRLAQNNQGITLEQSHLAITLEHKMLHIITPPPTKQTSD